MGIFIHDGEHSLIRSTNLILEGYCIEKTCFQQKVFQTARKLLLPLSRCIRSTVADSGFSPGECANFQNCYYFSKFCRKLHENERIWTPGGRASLAPPLGSANDLNASQNPLKPHIGVVLAKFLHKVEK